MLSFLTKTIRNLWLSGYWVMHLTLTMANNNPALLKRNPITRTCDDKFEIITQLYMACCVYL